MDAQQTLQIISQFLLAYIGGEGVRAAGRKMGVVEAGTASYHIASLLGSVAGAGGGYAAGFRDPYAFAGAGAGSILALLRPKLFETQVETEEVGLNKIYANLPISPPKNTSNYYQAKALYKTELERLRREQAGLHELSAEGMARLRPQLVVEAPRYAMTWTGLESGRQSLPPLPPPASATPVLASDLMAHIKAGQPGAIIEGQKVLMDSYESFHFFGDLLATTLMAYAAPKKEQDPATGVILDFFRNTNFDATSDFKAQRRTLLRAYLETEAYRFTDTWGKITIYEYPRFGLLSKQPEQIEEMAYLVEYASMRIISIIFLSFNAPIAEKSMAEISSAFKALVAALASTLGTMGGVFVGITAIASIPIAGWILSLAAYFVAGIFFIITSITQAQEMRKKWRELLVNVDENIQNLLSLVGYKISKLPSRRMNCLIESDDNLPINLYPDVFATYLYSEIPIGQLPVFAYHQIGFPLPYGYYMNALEGKFEINFFTWRGFSAAISSKYLKIPEGLIEYTPRSSLTQARWIFFDMNVPPPKQ